MVHLREECAADAAAIEALLDLAFGADRLQKTSYRYRDGIEPVSELSLVARDAADRLVGTIRYWPIRLSGSRLTALLLGPIAVDPALAGRGIGRALIFTSLESAKAKGFEVVFLVGAHDYYTRFGFDIAPPRVVMPDEQPSRLQYRMLSGGELPPGRFTLLASLPEPAAPAFAAMR